MAEVEAEAAVSDPSHEGLDARAALELNGDGFADARNDVALDHRAERGNVDDGDEMVRAAKGDADGLDELPVPRLYTIFDQPRRGARDQITRQTGLYPVHSQKRK